MGIVNVGMLTVYDEGEPTLKEKVEAVVLNKSPSAGEDLLEYAEDQRSERRPKI